jgi:thymidylate synthase (FAD)
MKIIEPRVDILTPITEDFLIPIERAGRTCYKSCSELTPETAAKFTKMLIERGHESVVEHVSITARFTGDRGFTHELVRMRLSSFSQESTRYCNYAKEKFGNELTFIKPWFFNKCDDGHCLGTCDDCEKYFAWENEMKNAEETYLFLIRKGAKPEEARSVLPNSLKTEIVMTANLREWRHVFRLRTAKAAHPQMRQIMRPFLDELKRTPAAPAFFDIEADTGDLRRPFPTAVITHYDTGTPCTLG